MTLLSPLVAETSPPIPMTGLYLATRSGWSRVGRPEASWPRSQPCSRTQSVALAAPFQRSDSPAWPAILGTSRIAPPLRRVAINARNGFRYEAASLGTGSSENRCNLHGAMRWHGFWPSKGRGPLWGMEGVRKRDGLGSPEGLRQRPACFLTPTSRPTPALLFAGRLCYSSRGRHGKGREQAAGARDRRIRGPQSRARQPKAFSLRPFRHVYGLRRAGAPRRRRPLGPGRLLLPCFLLSGAGTRMIHVFLHRGRLPAESLAKRLLGSFGTALAFAAGAGAKQEHPPTLERGKTSSVGRVTGWFPTCRRRVTVEGHSRADFAVGCRRRSSRSVVFRVVPQRSARGPRAGRSSMG